MVKRYWPQDIRTRNGADVSVEYVSAPDYYALAAARQHEFAYIEKVLKACSKATASDIRDELRDLRAWAANRSTCFSVEMVAEPFQADGGTPPISFE